MYVCLRAYTSAVTVSVRVLMCEAGDRRGLRCLHSGEGKSSTAFHKWL